MHTETTFAEYSISTDQARLQRRAIHAFLCDSYWSEGIPLETVERAIDHSLCFGLYHRMTQVGFARVVTDRTTFAYLADVYVLGEHRGQGLAKWLIRTVIDHDDLQHLRRFLLATRDAHGLYAAFGFATPVNPSRFMEIVNHDIYRKNAV